VFVGAGFDNFAFSCNFSLWLLHILALSGVVSRIFIFLLFALMLFKNWLLSRLFQTFFGFGLERSLELAFFLGNFNNFDCFALSFRLCLH
jgi:hypothetical protein